MVQEIINMTRVKDQNDGLAGNAEHFRFFDNREKYLLFVTTCSEKWVVAEQVGRELAQLNPAPPALRIFDAGMGDATVLTRVLRHAHSLFPNVPLFVVGKEISLEDVRLSLEKVSDRLCEHPQTVLVLTNLYYSEAPWLAVNPGKDVEVNWHDVPLRGDSAHEFDAQIRDLQSMLVDGWQVTSSARTGNPLYVRPSVLVLYREDQRFQLDRIIPKPGRQHSGYDLVIASQPFRARLDAESKVGNVLAPLARAIAPGGRMLTIQSYGNDPGLEIVREIWPNESPFQTDRNQLIDAMKVALGTDSSDLCFHEYSDERAIFRYSLHMLPSELSSIGTSTLLAAWNAAAYVAQIEDRQMTEAMASGAYLEATRGVLRKHNGLWFNDECFAVSRNHS